jgi:hypothetical protein
VARLLPCWWSLGCDYVLFDADAEHVNDLPTWDW